MSKTRNHTQHTIEQQKEHNNESTGKTKNLKPHKTYKQKSIGRQQPTNKRKTTTSQQKKHSNQPTKETRQPIIKRDTPPDQQKKHANQSTKEKQQPMRSFISDFSRARSAREKSKTCNHTQYTEEMQMGDNNQPTQERQQPTNKRNTPTNRKKRKTPTNQQKKSNNQ